MIARMEPRISIHEFRNGSGQRSLPSSSPLRFRENFMTMLQTIGILMFGFVVAIDAAVLLIDACLLLADMTTISQYVWRFPRLGIPLILFQLLAPLGLYIHFYLGLPQ